jgi:hypothetical protein
MSKRNATVSETEHTSVFLGTNVASVGSPVHAAVSAHAPMSSCQEQGDEIMLGIFAAVLIVLWLLGFFAFHITAGFIHIALVVGIILLVMHFMRRSTASV